VAKSPSKGSALSDAITRACILRCQAVSWAAIATELGYASADSAEQSLQAKNRETWRREYDKAREKHLAALEAAAEKTQVQLMQGVDAADIDDRRLAQTAGHSLLVHADRLKAQQITVDAKITGTMLALDAPISELARIAAAVGIDVGALGAGGTPGAVAALPAPEAPTHNRVCTDVIDVETGPKQGGNVPDDAA